MKKIWFVFLACLMITGCSYVDEDLLPEGEKASIPAKSIRNQYQVSIVSAKYFAESLLLDDSIHRNVKSIDVVAHGKDTLLYFINYTNNNGWLVLSGDKRTEAILAFSKTGKIYKNGLGGATTWFDDIAGKIYSLKQSNNNTRNKDYITWCKIDTLALGIEKTPITSTRVGQQDIYGDDVDEYEHVLINEKIEVISDKKVGPLIKTKWGQEIPWNTCTPFWKYTGRRCLTGCVAVAGAQMLYYFHYLKNKPDVFYSQGYCEGNVFDSDNQSTVFHFANPTPDVWDQMQKQILWEDRKETIGTQLVALLMGYVGKLVDMNYGDEASGARTDELVKVYRHFGINSEYADYTPASVRTSLDNQIPVNIRADSERDRKKILIFNIGWNYKGGHSWIIDGYRDQHIRHTSTYKKVPKVIFGSPTGLLKSQAKRNKKDGTKRSPGTAYEIYTTTYDEHKYYWKMNFGWEGSYDNGEYATCENAEWYADGNIYIYNKKIIHQFSF